MTRPLTEFFKTHGNEERSLMDAIADLELGHFLTAAQLGFETPSDMILWNDTPGRTKEEVMQRIAEAGL